MASLMGVPRELREDSETDDSELTPSSLTPSSDNTPVLMGMAASNAVLAGGLTLGAANVADDPCELRPSNVWNTQPTR